MFKKRAYMKKYMYVVAAFVFTSLLTLSTYTAANAQSNGLGITPRKDYTVKPGETIKDNLFVGNLSKDQKLRLKAQIVDFKAQDETGAPSLLQGQDKETTWSLKPFLTVSDNIVVEAGKSAQLPISITIPQNQGAGSYYSAIKYEVTTESGGNVSVLASSASLIFVKVPGTARQQLNLLQFGTYVSKNESEGTFKKLFASSTPSEIAYRLQNKGNIAEQPQGSIIIKDSFGKTVKTIEKANPKNSLILIDQTRKISVCTDSTKEKVKDSTGNDTEVEKCQPMKLKPGRYKIEMTMLYGENGNDTKEITAKSAFWYLPVWFVVIIFVLLAALAYGLYMLYTKFFLRPKKRRK